MASARITLDRDVTTGDVPRRLFGSFVENMGRCVYTGIFEPGHPTANESGFRRDVLELVRELGPTVVRYPGGNFVSGYNWEDGVGPVDKRPRRLDGAWHTLETNEFGLHEFMDWSKQANVEVMRAMVMPRASSRPRSTWTTSSSRSSQRRTPFAHGVGTRSTSTSPSTSGTSGASAAW